MTTSPLRVERDGHLLALTLDQPDTRNALTDQDMVDAICAACDQAQGDIGIRAVIITGSGKAFSSGGNIKHMRDRIGPFGGGPAELRDKYRNGIQRVTKAVHGLDVPTIAAVNGPAYGAGCDLTLCCDIRICAEEAIFAENFVKIGIIPGDGGPWLLPRALGRSRAAEMTFTGEPIDAQQALAWGLVSKVVKQEDLLAEAKSLAARIAANPPQALRMAKRLMREGEQLPLPSILEMSAAFQAALHHSKDHEEAVAAILDKRQPLFTGD